MKMKILFGLLVVALAGVTVYFGGGDFLQGKIAKADYDLSIMTSSMQMQVKAASAGEKSVVVGEFVFTAGKNDVKIEQFTLMPVPKQVNGSIPYINPVLVNTSNGKVISGGKIDDNGYVSFKDSFSIKSNAIFSVKVVANISSDASSESKFNLVPRYVGGLNLTTYKKIKVKISSGVKGTLVSVVAEISPALYIIAGTIKDGNNVSVANADISFHYISYQNGKIYRLEVVTKKTDPSGKFVITKDELEKGILQILGYSPEKPYPMTADISKNGYLDTYIFDESANQEESPKMIADEPWNIVATLKPVPAKLTKTDGTVTVKYYPGQEKCADIAMEKINYFYPKVLSYTGLGSFPESSLVMTFNTSWEQGWGDWWGGALGVATQCYSFTDDIEDPQIQSMWNEAIPHELTHVVISDFSDHMPYWSNEGLAQYVNRMSNGSIMVCNPAEFLVVQKLKGENLPYYETAACFWKLLEDGHPGIIHKTIKNIQKIKTDGAWLNYEYTKYTKDFVEKVLTPILVNDYDMSTDDAAKYLDDFMAQFHYDPVKLF